LRRENDEKDAEIVDAKRYIHETIMS
jgi:hypothetical protein